MASTSSTNAEAESRTTNDVQRGMFFFRCVAASTLVDPKPEPTADAMEPTIDTPSSTADAPGPNRAHARAHASGHP